MLTEAEVRSRYEVKLEKYNKIMNIEIRAMKRLVRRDYLPAINRYAAKLANGITAIKNVLPEGDTSFMKDKLEKLVAGAAEINRQLEKLHELHRASLEIDGPAGARRHERARDHPRDGRPCAPPWTPWRSSSSATPGPSRRTTRSCPPMRVVRSFRPLTTPDAAGPTRGLSGLSLTSLGASRRFQI